MIGKIYIITCDVCKNRMKTLKATNEAEALNAAIVAEWDVDNDAGQVCPECLAAKERENFDKSSKG